MLHIPEALVELVEEEETLQLRANIDLIAFFDHNYYYYI